MKPIILRDSERLILSSLLTKPLPFPELVCMLDMPETEVKGLLYQLAERDLVVYAPVSSGCLTCRCRVNFVYKLTYQGRQFITSNP